MANATEVYFEGKIAQKVIIEKENRVLLMRDPREKQIIWEIPGGRMNINEEEAGRILRNILAQLRQQVSLDLGQR